MTNKKNYKILLVDDEPDILEFIGYNLSKKGYKVYKATNGIDAIEIANKYIPHLILLDVMMPELNGIETCERIKSIPELKSVIIAFLTARGDDLSQIAGFNAGADDYIKKPISPDVLLSKINALLKRVDISKKDVNRNIKFKRFKIDQEKFIIIKGQKIIKLPRKEFELLVLLSSKVEKVFTRDEIFKLIWGDNIIVGDRTIDVHIRKLREKIGAEFIETVKGIGYKFIDV